MTEENTGHGSPGLPAVPAAGGSGRHPSQEIPAPFSADRPVPPLPATPPTSGIPAAAPAAEGSAARAAEPFARAQPGPEQGLPGSAVGPGNGPAGGLAAGRRVLAGKASLLGGWLRRLGLRKTGAGAAAVLVLGALVWWLSAAAGSGAGPSAGDNSPISAQASPAPAARGALPLEGVSPLDFRLGDCFKDFDPEAPQSSVVACDTGHSAQLVATGAYAPTDTYPGREALKQKALDACKGTPLTEKSAGYDLSYKLAYPSTNSWNTGDRRVDCFVTAAAGNIMMESLLPAP